jgi:hypothetical protein
MKLHLLHNGLLIQHVICVHLFVYVPKCILKMEISNHVANPVNYTLINCSFGQIRK